MEDEEKPKKNIELTKGQLGFGSVVVMAIMILNPVKEWFFTREEGRSQAAQIAELQHDLATNKEELTRRLERNTDKILEAIKESEGRTVKNEDRLDRRIEKIEVVLQMGPRRGSNN